MNRYLPFPSDSIQDILTHAFNRNRMHAELIRFVSCVDCHARLVISDAVSQWFFYDCNDYSDRKWQKYWTKPSLKDTRHYLSCVCQHCRPQHEYHLGFQRTSSVVDCSCSLCSNP